MSTIRIILACREFDRLLPANSTWTDFTGLQETALVSSGLAEFVTGSATALPGSGQIPITSVQFANPGAFGFSTVDSRTFLFNGLEYRGNGSGLEPTAAPAPAPGVGNATAGNQTTQIALETAIRDRLPASLGAKTAAASLAVTLADDGAGVASLNSIDAKLGNAANPTGSFTRPADTTAYASGDLVANSTTAGSCVSVSLTAARVAAGSFMLRRLKLHKSGTNVSNAQFRVHLFAAPVTFANGDNGAFSVSGAADYLGAFDVTIDRAFTDGAAGFGMPVIGSDITVKLASGTTIRAVLEARAAYTPANAEVFTVTLDDLQN